MPHTESAKKRHRQMVKRRTANRAQKTSIKTITKRVLAAIKAKDAAAATRELELIQARLDKAAKARVLHPNTAARKKAALAKRVAAIVGAKK